MNDSQRDLGRPFGRLRVTVERMPDGRTIRSYAWPDDDAAGAVGARQSDASGAGERDEAPGCHDEGSRS